ncbi:MAG: sulfite exporter TauE/SafE family protein [Cyclobacteriaceae bacterium]|nr:sulfite exporter TauE/SafE family protein [Cyclobacteriaceae bacterium]
MEVFFGYLASGLIGISLGLLGGGGSILTVPVLVYLFHVDPSLATLYSLFIVGTTSLVGGIKSAINKQVDFRTANVFAWPSLLAVFIARQFILPFIPEEIFHWSSFILTKDIALMVFFALIMLAAAISMLRSEKYKPETDGAQPNYFRIMMKGFGVGLLTGLIGAGGGFLIIPALVLLAGLPMKKAIGTSLIIIAFNSLLGFLGDVGSGQPINYWFMIIISGIAIAGVFVGNYVAKFIPARRLKNAFAGFVLVMAVWILVKELVF